MEPSGRILHKEEHERLMGAQAAARSSLHAFQAESASGLKWRVPCALQGVLLPHEIEGVLSATHRPIYCLQVET